MIQSLGRRFLLLCFLVLTSVFLAVWVFYCEMGKHQLTLSLDTITEMLSQNDQVLPDYPKNTELLPAPGGMDGDEPLQDFFTIWLDPDQQVLSINADLISEEDRALAPSYCHTVLDSSASTGWVNGYRWRIYPTQFGYSIALVNGRQNLKDLHTSELQTGILFVVSLVLTLCLLAAFMQKLMQPARTAEMKQKQFITNASHELKTPLSVIMADLDLLERTLPPVQTDLSSAESRRKDPQFWISEIREEGYRMKDLILSLITLTRLDEGQKADKTEKVSLSQIVRESAEEYADLMESIGLHWTENIDPGIGLEGNARQLQQLCSILFENAMKYADPGGFVSCALFRQKHRIHFIVENTCSGVESLEIDRLFERFYRADPNRTGSQGFGIGLSMAEEIVRQHHGKIAAKKKGKEIILFEVIF